MKVICNLSYNKRKKRRKYLRKLTSIIAHIQYGKWKKDLDAMYVRLEYGIKNLDEILQ